MRPRDSRDCLPWENATPLLICEYMNFTEDKTKGKCLQNLIYKVFENLFIR
jgi:hypothetical protein